VITALAATPQLVSEIPQVFQYNGLAYFEMQPSTIYHHRHHVSLQREYGLSFDRDQCQTVLPSQVYYSSNKRIEKFVINQLYILWAQVKDKKQNNIPSPSIKYLSAP